MYYPHVLRRLGAVPGMVRLVSFILECISVVFLRLHQDPSEVYKTDYMILSYLILVDVLEIASLCGQGRGWSLPALPILIAGDSIGGLMLVCSRDWYGLWYWHGPYYFLRHKIGIGLFVALPALRVELILLEGFEYWYENREDRLLAAERQFLLPH